MPRGRRYLRYSGAGIKNGSSVLMNLLVALAHWAREPLTTSVSDDDAITASGIDGLTFSMGNETKLYQNRIYIKATRYDFHIRGETGHAVLCRTAQRGLRRAGAVQLAVLSADKDATN
ncbi:hypothetical protein EVAR_37878_1 [Eumeta japonica]|uniref:Uncharacterized protein n=1 Tax=Eumeta variegata TaxID=151549 RepID=A0A4C1Y539_EUMVA|nr:hypothetical protein EVAR_37878_1 [Eumeta japonica]